MTCARIPFRNSTLAYAVACDINRRAKSVRCRAQTKRIETQMRRTDRDAFWLFTERQPKAAV